MLLAQWPLLGVLFWRTNLIGPLESLLNKIFFFYTSLKFAWEPIITHWFCRNGLSYHLCVWYVAWMCKWIGHSIYDGRLTGRVPALPPDTYWPSWSRTVCSRSPGPDGDSPSRSIPWRWGTEGWVLQAATQSEPREFSLNKLALNSCDSGRSPSWTLMPNIRRMLGDSNRLMVSTSSWNIAWTLLHRGDKRCVEINGTVCHIFNWRSKSWIKQRKWSWVIVIIGILADAAVFGFSNTVIYH